LSEFNVILDTPPEQRFPGVIQKTDFKQVLKFFRVLSLSEFTEEEKTRMILRIFFNEIPNDPKLWDYIIDFISCGVKDGSDSDKRVFDYNIDHGRLFSAFLQTYGIDLRTAEMHWWVFFELFQALPEDTKLMSVVEIRSKKPDKNDSPEYKKSLRKMQNAYRIEDNNHSALERALDGWV